MNFEDARAAVYGRLDTYAQAHSLTVVYENNELADMNTRTAPFVACELLWTGGEQIALGVAPPGRYRGAAWLAYWCKKGQGVAAANTLLAALADLFKATTFSGVKTQWPVPMPARDWKDWHVLAIRVPLWFDQLS